MPNYEEPLYYSEEASWGTMHQDDSMLLNGDEVQDVFPG